MRARGKAVERTRERIVQAAYDLWLELAYEQMTLDAIAEGAGVTRQTVIRQFGSKDDVAAAVIEWRAQRDAAEREAEEPGDVATAVSRLMYRYETMGDANVRTLEIEHRVEMAARALEQGRAAHRGWIEHVFGPFLPARRRRRERERAVLALYAATDVMTWKLLRRDFGRSRSDTEAVIRKLVEGVLATLETPAGRRGS